MKYLQLLLLTMISSFTFAQNTTTVKDAAAETMQKLSFLTGNWKGTGWFKAGEKTDSFTVLQDVYFREKNSELQIEIAMEQSGTKAAFNTEITISYDAAEKKYKTVTNNGGQDMPGKAELLNDHTLLTTLTASNGTQFKITHSFSKDYKVRGERSSDKGATWFTYMETTSSK